MMPLVPTPSVARLAPAKKPPVMFNPPKFTCILCKAETNSQSVEVFVLKNSDIGENSLPRPPKLSNCTFVGAPAFMTPVELKLAPYSVGTAEPPEPPWHGCFTVPVVLIPPTYINAPLDAMLVRYALFGVGACMLHWLPTPIGTTTTEVVKSSV